MAMSEDVAASLQKMFADFDSNIEKLEEIPKKALAKTEALLEIFFLADIFEEPEQYLKAIDDLSEQNGHAYHTVLIIELKRQGIVKPPSIPLPTNPQVDKSAGQMIIQTQPPKGGGLWDYMGTRSYAKVWERFLKSQSESSTTPQISTAREVIDILEFGRQLIPEFNRIQEYFQKCIDHLYFYDDKDTKERFHSELRKHMSKICGIVRVFCRTIAEYRKELVGDRKQDLGKAIIAMRMAELSVMGPMTKQDIYKMLSDAAGQQDFSQGR